MHSCRKEENKYPCLCLHRKLRPLSSFQRCTLLTAPKAWGAACGSGWLCPWTKPGSRHHSSHGGDQSRAWLLAPAGWWVRLPANSRASHQLNPLLQQYHTHSCLPKTCWLETLRFLFSLLIYRMTRKIYQQFKTEREKGRGSGLSVSDKSTSPSSRLPPETKWRASLQRTLQQFSLKEYYSLRTLLIAARVMRATCYLIINTACLISTCMFVFLLLK